MKDFAELRRVLMDRLDTARELKDEEILELIYELVIQNGRGRSLLEKEELRRAQAGCAVGPDGGRPGHGDYGKWLPEYFHRARGKAVTV